MQAAPSKAAMAVPAPGAEGYVGADTCKGCHEDQFATFARTRMGKLFLHAPRNQQEQLGCENCHGPGKGHVEAGGGKGNIIAFSKKDPTPVEHRNAVCLSCHEKTARLFWQGSPHESRDVACTNCHKVMEDVSPKSQLAKATEIETCGQCHLERRAQQMRSSHMPLREGKMTCTSCHNPHGGVTQHNLKANSVNETCYTCHAEKRGPFLWEHAPATESCTNCHDPHGSNHEKMLKLAKPRLCQQCHVVTRHPTRPYGQETSPSNFKFILGRQCVSCHVTIHGSNHPSGFALTR
jgi:DmsE family decaheme c-type cytochrome